MNRSDLIVRIATAERQLAYLREELEKENNHRYYLEEKRDGFGGRLKAVVIRDRSTAYGFRTSHTLRRIPHYPVAMVNRVGNLTEEEVLEAANRLLVMYRGSEK